MTESNNALAVANRLQVRSMADVIELGKMLAASGFFTDAKSAAQAGVKVLAGLELGFPTIASMVGVHIIEGKPSIGAHLLASLIRGSDRYDYEVVKRTREECELEFWERSLPTGGETRKRTAGWVKKPQNMRLTLKEATESGLVLSEKTGQPKRNWRTSSDDMLFARCISKGYRTYCPDLTGGTLVYVPDELDGEPAEARGLPAPPPVPTIDASYTVTLPDGSTVHGSDAGTTPAAEEPRPNLPAPPPAEGELTEQEVAELTALARSSNAQRPQPLSMGQAKAILAVLGVPVLQKAPRAKLDWMRQAFTTGLAPTPQVDRIAALVTELQLEWPKFRARLRQKFGSETIAHLLPAQADEVEKGLKAEKAKRQQQQPAPAA